MIEMRSVFISRFVSSGVRSLWLLGLGYLLAGCATDQAGARDPEVTTQRNVILFLGDGMGVSTVTAARILAGQREGKTGEEHVLPFETFRNVALVKTYNTDSQVADSAGTMSALMTGEKTRIGVISIAANVPRNDCVLALANKLPTLLEQAEDAGFATGVVSTARITHATPAATYAHSPNRNWEADAALPEAAVQAGCHDIAQQLINFDHGDGIDVILGGGRSMFLPQTMADPEYPDKQGARADSQNLIDVWLQQSPKRQYVWNQQQFADLSSSATASSGDQLLGLFEPSHMQFEHDRPDDRAGEPSIAEMTKTAIKRLQGSSKGFFLMVEGGRIDHGHHAGNAYRALTDALAFSEAVQVAMDATDSADTLIMVTADHSHTFTISGYPRRGNPIFGKVVDANGDAGKDTANRPYTTLGYANGPGYEETIPDLTQVDTESPNYRQLATLPLASETHGGEDVAAYARGPNADRLRGVMEQQTLYNVLRDALFRTDGAGN